MKFPTTILSLVIVTFFCASNARADTLTNVQGAWEIRFTENGRSLRALKTIKDDTETTSTFDGDKLVYNISVKLNWLRRTAYSC